MTPLVSVIVPVYNVENYLEECISHIINQTYKNLEVILVNDGSTDTSALICTRWALLDNRIKVLNKLNGGLSSARNAGLDVAKGKIISFCDSDDYMHPEMLNRMLEIMERTKAEIVCCDYVSTFFHELKKKVPYSIFDSNEAISYLMDDKGYKCFAWNKIYRKELFNIIRYPEGKLFEDIETTYKIFKTANRIAYLQEPLYYYRVREGSITKTKFSVKNYDLIEAIDYVINDVQKNKNPYFGKVMLGYMGYYFEFIKSGLRHQIDMKNEKSRLKQIVKKNKACLVKENSISFKKRIELLVFCINDRLFCFIINLYWERNNR